MSFLKYLTFIPLKVPRIRSLALALNISTNFEEHFKPFAMESLQNLKKLCLSAITRPMATLLDVLATSASRSLTGFEL